MSILILIYLCLSPSILVRLRYQIYASVHKYHDKPMISPNEFVLKNLPVYINYELNWL